MKERDTLAIFRTLTNAAIVTILCWIAILTLFRDTVLSMVAIWANSSTFAHGFFILPTSLWIAWRRRNQVHSLLVRPSLWGLVVLVLLVGIWLVAKTTEVLVLQHIAVIAILQVVTWTMLGSQITLAFLFPLMFLLFMVPAGEGLVAPLQDFTALFAVKVLQLSGIPVLQEGRFITTPSQVWEVAEACSAIRYVIPAGVLACLYSYLMYWHWARRIVFIVASVITMMVANGFRVYVIILLSYLQDRTFLAGMLANAIDRSWGHLIYGWILFGGIMSLLFWLGSKWLEPSTLPKDVKLFPEFGINPLAMSRIVAVAGAAVAIVAMGPLAEVLLTKAAPPHVSVNFPSLYVQQPWAPAPSLARDWFPHFGGADAEFAETYIEAGGRVQLYIAYYANQRQGAELINEANRLIDGTRWRWLAEAQRSVFIDGHEVRVQETVTRESDSHRPRVFWNWYWVAGQFTANVYYAKVLEAKSRLLGGPDAAAVIAIAIDDVVGTSAAEILQSFVNHLPLSEGLNQIGSPPQ